MATNFSVKLGEIGLFAFIPHSGIPKRIVISHKVPASMISLHRVKFGEILSMQ